MEPGKSFANAAGTSTIDGYSIGADWNTPLITAQTIYYKSSATGTLVSVDVLGCTISSSLFTLSGNQAYYLHPMTKEPRATEGDVRAFWEASALTARDKDGLRPTARDPYLQTAVEDAIEQYIPRGSRLLDIGCGDGLSTIRFSRTAAEVVGVDYIEQFVERAQENAKRESATNITFVQGSVLDLSPVLNRFNSFDAAVSIRCIINLGSTEKQAKAIGEIARCVRPGGLYLVSEGWSDGMDGLNAMRAKFSLAPIETVRYNLLMDRHFFLEVSAPFFEVEHYRSLGFYLFMSRVVQPVAVAPAQPRHDHPINRVAAEFLKQNDTDSFRECDYAGVYVLRRR